MPTYAPLAIETSFTQHITSHDTNFLTQLCKKQNLFSEGLTLSEGFFALPEGDNWWFILAEYHHWQIIIDKVRTNHIETYNDTLYQKKTLGDFVPLREFLDLDIFCQFSDAALIDIGISPSIIPNLRELKTPNTLNQFINECCDEENTEILLNLNRIGYLAASAVFIENLQKNMSLPEWRTYLHPTQLHYVRTKWPGPFLLTGAAGTGKTLITMHRALELAQKASTKERILMTTYGKTLTETMRRDFRHICDKNDQLFNRVEIEPFNDLAERIFKAYHDPKSQVQYKEDVLKTIWNKLITQYALPSSKYNADFLQHEWRRVIIAENCFTEEAWLQATLHDSCRPEMSVGDRKELWPVFESYIEEMRNIHQYDIFYAMHICEEILNTHPELHYAHILVDECQDLPISAMRMIRALAGQEHENDIFLCGDFSQRIYATRQGNFNSIINTTGRMEQLILNYRTPQSIHDYAYQLLPENTRPQLTNSYGIPSGIPPILRTFDSIEAECAFVCEEIKKLIQKGKAPANICIAHRKNTPLETYMAALSSNNIPVYRIEQNAPFDDPSKDGVRATTLHRMKGLEFDVIFFVGASEDHLNCGIRHQCFQDDIDDAVSNEQCLHYVALTRARQRAWITSPETKFSHFILNIGAL